jgi:chromosome condensin MukBEF ATPase and DNA-binding subunit MukB
MTPEERLAVLEAEMRDVRDDVKEIAADMKVVRDTLSQAKGGWRTLMLVAGCAGASGALAAKLLLFFRP